MADMAEIAKYTKADNGLPLQPQLKITAKSVFAGNPKQIADLLMAGVAQAVVEVKKTKSNIPLYAMKLRCSTLWVGNLDVHFLLDWPNMKLMDDGSGLLVCDMKLVAQEDQERAEEFRHSLEVAMSYWNVRMEEVVHQLYPDKTPVQTDTFANDAVLQLKSPSAQGGVEFKLGEFLASCVQKTELLASRFRLDGSVILRIAATARLFGASNTSCIPGLSTILLLHALVRLPNRLQNASRSSWRSVNARSWMRR
jgi:hypothetical protein